jgi:hypothetical protein
MVQHLIKTGALALALGGLAAAGQAYALTPIPVDRTAPFAIPVVDEQQQVDEHLNAADMPAQPEGQAPQREVKEPAAAGSSGGDVEEKELQNMFPSTDWPKK